MKNKQTKISNKIVKKLINSSNQMWFTPYSRRDFTQPLYLSPPTGLRAPKTPSPNHFSWSTAVPVLSIIKFEQWSWSSCNSVMWYLYPKLQFQWPYKIKDFTEGGEQDFWPPLAVFCLPWNVNDTIKIRSTLKNRGFY